MLAMNITKMRNAYGPNLFQFVPTTFILPKEKVGICILISSSASEQEQFVRFVAAAGTHSLWICKPSASARGKGIFVFDDLKSFWSEAVTPCVVQSYIPRPMMVAGYKFDLRLYCLLTSVWPLKCYLHTKGTFMQTVD